MVDRTLTAYKGTQPIGRITTITRPDGLTVFRSQAWPGGRGTHQYWCTHASLEAAQAAVDAAWQWWADTEQTRWGK